MNRAGNTKFVVDSIQAICYIYACQEGTRAKEVVKLEAFIVALLATVLGNIVSHFVIRAYEKQEARRKGTGKHMRRD